MNWSGRPTINVAASDRKSLDFQNVRANDISGWMSIRVASVNGMEAETASRNGVLQIRAFTRNEFDRNGRFLFERGEIKGYTNNATRESRLIIPNTIWGDPVISIGNRAFSGNGLTYIRIPESVRTVGDEAFRANGLTSVVIPNRVSNCKIITFTS